MVSLVSREQWKVFVFHLDIVLMAVWYSTRFFLIRQIIHAFLLKWCTQGEFLITTLKKQWFAVVYGKKIKKKNKGYAILAVS